MRTAIIQNNLIANVIITQDGWIAPEGVLAMPESEAMERGFEWVKDIPPPEPEVTSITKLQRNLWLATKGLYNQATTWINKPDEQTLIRQIYWRDAETTKIDDPITIALAEELGLKTREQRVSAFREASKIG